MSSGESSVLALSSSGCDERRLRLVASSSRNRSETRRGSTSRVLVIFFGIGREAPSSSEMYFASAPCRVLDPVGGMPNSTVRLKTPGTMLVRSPIFFMSMFERRPCVLL